MITVTEDTWRTRNWDTFFPLSAPVNRCYLWRSFGGHVERLIHAHCSSNFPEHPQHAGSESTCMPDTTSVTTPDTVRLQELSRDSNVCRALRQSALYSKAINIVPISARSVV